MTEPRWLAPSEAHEGLDYQAGVVRTCVTLEECCRFVTATAGNRLPVGWTSLFMRRPDRFPAEMRLAYLGGWSKVDRHPTRGSSIFRSFLSNERKVGFFACVPCRFGARDSTGGLGPSQACLSNLRQRLNELTWKYVDEDEAAFASAILLGNREQLSAQRRELFLETGTVHLLAISGLHVGILAGSFFLFFRVGLVNRQYCLWATIVFVIFYAWLVEFRPPVSRAAILIVLYCIGRLLGENSFSYNLLAIAGLIVLMT